MNNVNLGFIRPSFLLDFPDLPEDSEGLERSDQRTDAVFQAALSEMPLLTADLPPSRQRDEDDLDQEPVFKSPTWTPTRPSAAAKVESPSTPKTPASVSKVAVASSPSTPKTPQAALRFDPLSPSIHASPTVPNQIYYTHSAEQLFNRATKGVVDGLERKHAHSLYIAPGSIERKSKKIIERHDEVSKHRKHLDKHPGAVLPPIQADPETLIRVVSPREVQVESRPSGKRRTFSFHEQTKRDGSKTSSIYPKKQESDTDIVHFEKDTDLTPEHLAKKLKSSIKDKSREKREELMEWLQTKSSTDSNTPEPK